MRLVKVRSVYGKCYRIDKDKYDQGKVLLGTYNNKGVRVKPWDGKGTEGLPLHRENIKHFIN